MKTYCSDIASASPITTNYVQDQIRERKKQKEEEH